MALQVLDQLLIDLIYDTAQGDIPDLLRVTNRALKELARKHEWRVYQTQGTITLLASYNEGTVSVTNGSPTVTGVGTTFTAAMVGRKFKISDQLGRYRVDAFVDPQHLTLAQNWPHDDQTGASYSIYQDTYPLPADLRKLIKIVDSPTGFPYSEMTFEERIRFWNGSVYSEQAFTYPEEAWPYKYTQYGYDGTNLAHEILVNAVSQQDRVLDVYYHRWPAGITRINEAPDISESMEDALYQIIKRIYTARLPADTQDQAIAKASRMAECRRDVEMAIRDARKQDSRVTLSTGRNQRVMF